jgi:hypothetical protein
VTSYIKTRGIGSAGKEHHGRLEGGNLRDEYYRKHGNIRQSKTDEYMFIVDEYKLCSLGNRQT